MSRSSTYVNASPGAAGDRARTAEFFQGLKDSQHDAVKRTAETIAILAAVNLYGRYRNGKRVK